MIDKEFLRDEIINALKSVYDPEIPVDIWELGLIYDIEIDDEANVKITMTLTAPNCPVADSLPLEVQQKVESLYQVKKANVNLTFDPPWTKDMMSDQARIELNLF